MKNFLSKLNPELSLRVALGLMYIYSGTDIILHPTSWHWAIQPIFRWFPDNIQLVLNKPEIINNYLMLQGLGELVLALIFLGWFWPKFIVKWAVFVSVLEFVGILILVPIDAITFRDIGLLGAFIALWSTLRTKTL